MIEKYTIELCKGRWYVIGPDNGIGESFEEEEDAAEEALRLNRLAYAQPCRDCGSTEDVTFDTNPYREEIRGDKTEVWMCGKCRKASLREI